MLKYRPMDPFEMHRLGLGRHDTASKFRRQVWLQVYLPLAVGVMLLAGLSVGLWRGQVGTVSAWADTALSLLLLPVLVLGLILLAVLASLAYGVWYAVRRLPEPFQQVRLTLARVEHGADEVVHKAALPLIVPKAVLHAISSAIRYLTAIFRQIR